MAGDTPAHCRRRSMGCVGSAQANRESPLLGESVGMFLLSEFMGCSAGGLGDRRRLEREGPGVALSFRSCDLAGTGDVEQRSNSAGGLFRGGGAKCVAVEGDLRRDSLAISRLERYRGWPGPAA